MKVKPENYLKTIKSINASWNSFMLQVWNVTMYLEESKLISSKATIVDKLNALSEVEYDKTTSDEVISLLLHLN